MRFKRIAAAALCLVLIVTASVLTDTPASTTASAKTVEDYQSEIKDLEAEQREIEAELKKLKSEKAEKQAENPFKKLNREKGFRVALGEITAFVKALILRIKNQLRHIRITRLCLGINVAADDAALTAIYYGAVCSAVYPLLSLLDSLSSIAFKQIDIRADFESTKPGLAFSARIKLQLFFLLAAAFAALSEFNKFKKRNEL